MSGEFTIKGFDNPQIPDDELLKLLHNNSYYRQFNVTWIHNGYVVYRYYFTVKKGKNHIYEVLTSISLTDDMFYTPDRVYSLSKDNVNINNTEFIYRGYGKIARYNYL